MSRRTKTTNTHLGASARLPSKAARLVSLDFPILDLVFEPCSQCLIVHTRDNDTETAMLHRIAIPGVDSLMPLGSVSVPETSNFLACTNDGKILFDGEPDASGLSPLMCIPATDFARPDVTPVTWVARDMHVTGLVPLASGNVVVSHENTDTCQLLVSIYDANGAEIGYYNQFDKTYYAGANRYRYLVHEGPQANSVRAIGLARSNIERSKYFMTRSIEFKAPEGPSPKGVPAWLPVERHKFDVGRRPADLLVRCPLPSGRVVYAVAYARTVQFLAADFRLLAHHELSIADRLMRGDAIAAITYIPAGPGRKPMLAGVFSPVGRATLFLLDLPAQGWVANRTFRGVVRAIMQLVCQGSQAGTEPRRDAGRVAAPNAAVQLWGALPLEVIELVLDEAWRLTVLASTGDQPPTGAFRM